MFPILASFVTAAIFDFHGSAYVDATLNDQWTLFTWSLQREEAVDFRRIVETVILWWGESITIDSIHEVAEYTIFFAITSLHLV